MKKVAILGPRNAGLIDAAARSFFGASAKRRQHGRTTYGKVYAGGMNRLETIK